MDVQRPMYLIGRKERVSFPDMKRSNIVARIDSGALSSSAHCDKIWIEQLGGQRVLCCHFLKNSHKVVRFHEYKKRRVRSSNGLLQVRYVVKLRIKLGPVTKRTDVTLTDRSMMNHTVLLGRRFLKGHFLIDVARSYLLGSSSKAPARKSALRSDKI